MNRKIEKAKKKRELEAQSRELQEKGIKASKSLEKAIHSLSELINGQDEYDFARLEKQLEKIDKSLDLTKHFTNLERSIKQISPRTDNKTKIQDFSKLLKAVSDNKPLPVNIDLTKLEKAVVNIEQYISEQSEPSDQGAENYQPVRRVLKIGNRFIFDDNFTNAGGGGGGGSSTVGLTNAELRATPVPVSMSSDIEIGAVELKNGTDDTRATVTAGNALKVDGSAVTQPISGTVTATPSGTQNVDVTANTIGLATSANQLPDGHNVTVDNGAGASAVNIQDGGNSITVDGTVTASNISGDVASGSADSGNPVKVGAKYNATQPTFTDGQRADMQVDSRGNLRMGLYANNTQTTASFKADNADTDATSATANKLGVMSRGTVFNGTTWDRQRGDATNGTLVNLGANNDVTVTSGAITETNSAAIKTAVETIDNIVSGTGANISQVGGTNIDTNSGSKSAGTQRVVLATDQPQLTNALKVDGSGVTQPISGSVTAIAQPGVDIGDVTVNNTTANPVPVQPPLSGYLNVSIDQTGNNNAVDVLTMPTVTETNSGAIKTAVETIDNAVSGAGFNITQFAGTNNAVGSGTATGALRVELPTNGTGTVGLNAGTNAIGKLSANSGVDIGDVDVTSTVLPTGAGTSSVTSVADTTTSATLIASNSARKEVIITNDSSATLYVKYGTTASSTNYTVSLDRGDSLFEDRYTGRVDGIWATDPNDGAARITEIT